MTAEKSRTTIQVKPDHRKKLAGVMLIGGFKTLTDALNYLLTNVDVESLKLQKEKENSIARQNTILLNKIFEKIDK